jgi:hypothetical protein
MDQVLNGLTAGLNNRVFNSGVDSEGRFKLISTGDNNVLQSQRFDESLWVDVAKLIFVPLLKSSKLIMNELDI